MDPRRRVRLVLTVAVAVAAVMALLLAVTSALTQAYSLQSPAPVVSTYYSTPIPVDGASPSPWPTYPSSEPAFPSSGTAYSTGPPLTASPNGLLPTSLDPRPTGAQAEPGQRAQDILDRCGKGRMAFRTPSPLKQGEKVGFVVRVAFETSPIDPGSGLPGRGEPTRRETLLCEKMRADLTSTGMKIERTTSDTISLPKSRFGEWGWHITGVEPGRHDLELRLTVPDPKSGDTLVVTYNETIQIDVGLTYLVSTWIKDMAAPIDAFLGSIVIVGGWIAVLFAQKRVGKHSAKSRAG